YSFAENDVIRSIDLDGLERAVVINEYANGAKTRTIIQTLTDGEVTLNFLAAGNGINGDLSIDDILVINRGDLPENMDPFNVREEFTEDERSILSAGIDGSQALVARPDRVSTTQAETNRSDEIASIEGFSFLGAKPSGDKDLAFLWRFGTYGDQDVFEEKTIRGTKTVIEYAYGNAGGYSLGFTLDEVTDELAKA
ncbi:MAG: hypothetical protein AAFO03_27110, partial [Bacteroidota bacterium]